MNRVSFRLVIAWAAVAPGVGCMSLGSGGLFPEMPQPLTANTVGSTKPGEKSPELPPKDAAKVCVTLAETLEQNGHLKEAMGQYEKARLLDPRQTPQLTKKVALLHDKLGNGRQALEEYQAALKLSPKDADLLNNVGYCHYNRGKWKEAEDYYRQALAVNPKHARAQTNLGMCLAQQGQYAAAFEAFVKVVRPAEAHSNLAFVMFTQGKKDDAKKEYAKALKLEPDMQIARVALEKMDKHELPKSSGEVETASK